MLKKILATMFFISSTTTIALDDLTKPPAEAPDPLNQFAEHEYIKDKLWDC